MGEYWGMDGHFPPACYNCGLSEISLVVSEEVQQPKEAKAVVHPISFMFLRNHFVETPSDVAK